MNRTLRENAGALLLLLTHPVTPSTNKALTEEHNSRRHLLP
jgi:hypothetical protein